MTAIQQRYHCVSVRAYFLAKQREGNGTPGTPESDWITAESEEDRRIESSRLHIDFTLTTVPEERARTLVTWLMFNIVGVAIGDQTPLPTDGETRRILERSIASQIDGIGYFYITDRMATVGECVGALSSAIRQSTARRIAYSHL
jgi:hypothetical protein